MPAGGLDSRSRGSGPDQRRSLRGAGVAVAPVPIGRDPFRAKRRDFRGEILLRTARQNETPGVVGQSMEAWPVKTGRPADPVVARFRFEGGGGKH